MDSGTMDDRTEAKELAVPEAAATMPWTEARTAHMPNGVDWTGNTAAFNRAVTINKKLHQI
jgi:hypothetical protein